ncbi:ig family protein [Stylonychia lemnae]|uniref:Ig family protein n=1 Tax=Stylonychia lemnae TaxID=5949 RepID=A0A078ABI0_STYLE|nr:ig family protein [Stylonychia lemnae]|eukprot:CDW79544.1 ig family protein [Stylonychia lemnae]
MYQDENIITIAKGRITENYLILKIDKSLQQILWWGNSIISGQSALQLTVVQTESGIFELNKRFPYDKTLFGIYPHIMKIDSEYNYLIACLQSKDLKNLIGFLILENEMVKEILFTYIRETNAFPPLHTMKVIKLTLTKFFLPDITLDVNWSGTEFGCLGFSDLQTFQQSQLSKVEMTNLLNTFVDDDEVPNNTCDVNQLYNIANIPVLSIDFRPYQLDLIDKQNCTLTEGMPTISFNQGNSVAKNNTLCFIDFHCSLDIGQYHMPECSDISEIKVIIKDLALDEVQFNKEYTLNTSIHYIFPYDLQEYNDALTQKRIQLGDHFLKLTASLKFANGFVYSSQENVFKVKVAYCYEYLKFSKSPNFESMYYMIASETQKQKFLPYQYWPEGCGNLNYRVFLSGGERLPNCINFNGLNRLITVDCTDSKLGGNQYNLSIQAFITDKNGSERASSAISQIKIVLISDAFKINTTAPMFNQPPADQTIIEGQLFSFKLPDIIDNDGSGYQITSSFDSSGAFAKQSQGMIEFSPDVGFAGTYEITIKLKDSSNSNAYNKYSFKVTVIPSIQLNISEVNRIQSIKDQIKGYLKARIKMVTNQGLVYITFSKKMLIYSNFEQQLNNSLEVFLIKIINSQLRVSNNEREIKVDYQVKFFQDLTLILQEFDFLKVIFLRNYEYVSLNKLLIIPEKYEITSILPPQVSSGKLIKYR